jgi:DNA-binding CsgD family transcriptional regulator
LRWLLLFTETDGELSSVCSIGRRISGPLRAPIGYRQGGPAAVLSKRELQVLLLICDELQSKEIAKRLGISPKTVEFHTAGIHEHLGLKDTAHLVRYAIRHGPDRAVNQPANRRGRGPLSTTNLWHKSVAVQPQSDGSG